MDEGYNIREVSDTINTLGGGTDVPETLTMARKGSADSKGGTGGGGGIWLQHTGALLTYCIDKYAI